MGPFAGGSVVRTHQDRTSATGFAELRQEVVSGTREVACRQLFENVGSLRLHPDSICGIFRGQAHRVNAEICQYPRTDGKIPRFNRQDPGRLSDAVGSIISSQ
jgi:hypothetical protein